MNASFFCLMNVVSKTKTVIRDFSKIINEIIHLLKSRSKKSQNSKKMVISQVAATTTPFLLQAIIDEWILEHNSHSLCLMNVVSKTKTVIGELC